MTSVAVEKGDVLSCTAVAVTASEGSAEEIPKERKTESGADFEKT